MTNNNINGDSRNAGTSENERGSGRLTIMKRMTFGTMLVLALAGGFVGFRAYDAAKNASAEKELAGLRNEPEPSMADEGSAVRMAESLHMSSLQGDMERVARANVGAIAALREKYDKDLAAIGWGGILNPERIKKDKDLAGSMAMIIRAREIARTQQAGLDKAFVQFRDELAAVAPDEPTRKTILRGFEEKWEKSRPILQKSSELENKIIANTQEFFMFLSAKKGEWNVKNGKITFVDQKEQAEFDRIQQKVIDSARESDSFQSEINARLHSRDSEAK